MILKKIRLENIRSYVNGEIEFKPGTSLLSGDIGAGKSTILLSIEFALFGILRGELSGSVLLRHGKNEGFVELHFEIDKKEVIIRRYLKKSQNTIKQDAGYIIINGVKQDATAVELKTKILSLLGYPDELLTKSKSMIYRYTVYTPQEEMKSILFEDKEERLNTLRRVFGIDKYKRIVEHTQIITRKIKEDKKEIMGKISDLEKKKNDLLELNKKLDLNKISQLDEKKKLDLLLQKKESLEKDFLKVESEIQKLVLLNQTKAKLSERLVQQDSQKKSKEKEFLFLKKELELLNAKEKEYAKLEFSYEEIEIELKKLNESYSELSKKEIELTQKINHVTSQIDLRKKWISEKDYSKLDTIKLKIEELSAFISKKTEVESTLTELDLNLKKISSEISTKEFKKNELIDSAKKILSLDNCPTCMQSVSLNHKRSIQLKNQEESAAIETALKPIYHKKSADSALIVTLKEELKNILNAEVEKKGLEVKLQNLIKEKTESLSLQEELSLFLSKKIELEKEVALIPEGTTLALKKQISDLENLKNLAFEKKSVLLKLEDKKNNFEKISADLKAMTDAILDVENSLNLIEKEYLEKKVAEEHFLKIKKEMDLLLNLEKNSEKLLSSFETEKKILGESKINLEKEVFSKEFEKSRLQKLNSLQSYLETHFVNLMLSMETHVMTNLNRQFSELFSKWFSILVEDEDLHSKIDDEFSPVIIQNGYESTVENLSGGEKTAVALAYRLSLNKVINEMMSSIKTKDLIILDEPTDGFSGEQLDRIKDVLDELNMGQIIIVSHEPKIESFVEHVLRVVKRGHTSEVMS